MHPTDPPRLPAALLRVPTSPPPLLPPRLYKILFFPLLVDSSNLEIPQSTKKYLEIIRFLCTASLLHYCEGNYYTLYGIMIITYSYVFV